MQKGKELLMATISKRSEGLNGRGGVALVVTSVVFGLLAIAATILRVVSRRLSRARLGWTDHMIFIALVIMIISLGVSIGLAFKGGAGQQEDQLTKQQVTTYWKLIFVIVTIWPITQTAVKLSILLFYVQIFVTRTFRIAAFTTMFVVSVWCAEQVLASVLICRPISYSWNPDQKGSCGNVRANCIAGAAINVATDLWILFLPMPVIWSLNLPAKSKISISFVFGIGLLICVISIVRLNALIAWSVPNGTYKNTMALISTVLESSLSIICACLVVMRPLFNNLFPSRLRARNEPGKYASSTDPPTSSSNRFSRPPAARPRTLSGGGSFDGDHAGQRNMSSAPGRFQCLEDEIYPLTSGGQKTPSNMTTVEVDIVDPANRMALSSESSTSEHTLTPGTIMVKREWEVGSWMA